MNPTDELLSFDVYQVLAPWKPLGVLHPRVVSRLPTPQSTVTAKAFDVVTVTSVIEASGGELLGSHGHTGGPAAEGLQTGRVGPHARVGHGALQRVLELPVHKWAVREVSQVFRQSAVVRLPVAQLPITGEAGYSVPGSHIIETGSGQILRRRGGQGPGLEGEQPVLCSLQGSLTGAGPPGSKLPILSEVYGTRWEAGIRPAEIARGLQAGQQRVCGARGGRRLPWRTAGSGLRGCA